MTTCDVIWQSKIFYTDTGKWTPQEKILGRGVSLIVEPSPWQWSPYMSSPFSNLFRWFFILSSKHLSINGPHIVSLPGSLKSLETFLTALIIALNVSSSPIINWIPLLKMVISINEVYLASAAENILPEVTDTVDNIDYRTSWSLNVDIWCLFLPYYWSNRSNKI